MQNSSGGFEDDEPTLVASPPAIPQANKEELAQLFRTLDMECSDIAPISIVTMVGEITAQRRFARGDPKKMTSLMVQIPRGDGVTDTYFIDKGGALLTSVRQGVPKSPFDAEGATSIDPATVRAQPLRLTSHDALQIIIAASVEVEEEREEVVSEVAALFG